MPWPSPTYTGGQDEDLTRSIDVVHIEPSIREGVHLVSSLYGPEASAPIFRYPPVSSDNAWIRGDAVIPSVLTAEEGTWDWSPTGYFQYQWMADGVDIPFATSKTWTSTPEYDGQTITVEIRGINTGGMDITISSGLAISILEPVIVDQQDNFVITGLPQGNDAQTTRDERTMIISGVGADDRLDVVRSASYFATGMGALDRHDVNSQNNPIITGLGDMSPANGRLCVFERDWSIAVINQEYADPLVDSVPVQMNIKNRGAEMGLLGWNVFGTVWYQTDHRHSGYYAWDGGEGVDANGANTPFSYIWQDVPIEDAWIVDVDAGLTNLEVNWQQYSYAGLDMANVRVEYLDANLIVLGNDPGPGLWASPSGIYFYRGFEDPIPVGTRFVRIYLEFNLQSGSNNDGGIDSVWMAIRKGAKLQDRSFGPDFQQWRINFLQANTWSGTGLSELEFRATSGGADLAVGGSPIFGSAGLGVANADFAFDDLRNTGYWAGEENGVANGTAWIGYDMGVGVQPQAIDITARSGSDSLQVGRQFIVQGSDDGIRWTDVQYVPESRIGTFTSGQQKEVKLASGLVPYYRDFPEAAPYTYTRDIYSGDDFAGKGGVWQAHARLNIDEIAMRIDDQAAAYNCRLQLCRINTQKNGGWNNIGMVEEVLEDIAFTTPGLNGGDTWFTFPTSQVWEFEVYEYFLLRFVDLDAATNPVDPNEGRIKWINSWNGAPTPYELRDGAVTRVAVWDGGNENIGIGFVNPSGFQGSSTSIGRYWALDFKGSIF